MSRQIDLRPGIEAGRRYMARWTAMESQVTILRGSPSWQAWKDYFRAKGLRVQSNLMIDGRAEMDVPAHHPDEFDPPVTVDERRYKD